MHNFAVIVSVVVTGGTVARSTAMTRTFHINHLYQSVHADGQGISAPSNVAIGNIVIVPSLDILSTEEE